MKNMGYGGMGMTKMGMAKKGMTMKMSYGGMVNPNAPVKVQTSGPKKTTKSKSQPAPKKGK